MAEVPLAGRTAIVTGGTRGLGAEIARAFTAAGAHVIAPGRAQADVTDPEACARLAAHEPDILVNNAAITGPVGPLERNDWDEWTRTIATNLLGPVQLCRAVIPGMRERGRGKIINLSGGGATGPRPNFSAYATAKAGLVRFTETLARELDGTGIDVNAIAPGPLNTRMREDILDAGPELAGPEYEQARTRGETSFEPATRLAVFLASAASDGISGRLLAALWDDWETLQPPLDADVYTLRRIS